MASEGAVPVKVVDEVLELRGSRYEIGTPATVVLSCRTRPRFTLEAAGPEALSIPRVIEGLRSDMILFGSVKLVVACVEPPNARHGGTAEIGLVIQAREAKLHRKDPTSTSNILLVPYHHIQLRYDSSVHTAGLFLES